MQWNTKALIPALVAAVVVMAVAAVWMSGRHDAEGFDRTTTAAASARSAERPQQPIATDVVRAPPIGAPDTSVVGGPPANSTSIAIARAESCADCGTVESVQATPGHARFVMEIRMGNGSVKTVEQAAPLVVGSRVVLRGGVARPVSSGMQG